jgi:hypothetical protein
MQPPPQSLSLGSGSGRLSAHHTDNGVEGAKLRTAVSPHDRETPRQIIKAISLPMSPVGTSVPREISLTDLSSSIDANKVSQLQRLEWLSYSESQSQFLLDDLMSLCR